MKKYALIVLASIVAGCQKVSILEELNNEEPVKTVVFDLGGWDVSTRGDLNADGKDMTDLWVFDYVDDECVQTVHQTDGDEDFGSPAVPLSYGEHHIYFVASRGEGAVVDGEIITWTKVRDTFWNYAAINVTASMGTQSVTLSRVVTKLKVTVTDAVPNGCASIEISPSTWYKGFDYLTGEAADEVDDAVSSISVPSSYIGTSGQLQASVYGFSDEMVWNADVAITARDGSGNNIGSVTISDAPFKRNRSTNFSGALFTTDGTFDIGLEDSWLTPVEL